MQNSFEYFVKRKRKRHAAVDPCLGVYLPSSSPHAASSSNCVESSAAILSPALQNSLIIPETSGDESKPQALQNISRQNALRYTPSKSDTNTAVVTVGRFLRTYADPSKPKKPARRKRRKQDFSQDGKKETPVEEEIVSIKPPKLRKCAALRVVSSSPEPCDMVKVKASSSQRRRRARRPLSDRLFEAAVMSHGDPVDDLVDTNVSTSESSRRPPLRFVPSVDQSCQRTHQKRARVDPRRSSSIRTASFISARGRITDTPSNGLKPITQWTILQQFDGEERTTERTRNPRASTQSVTVSTRRPLTFVPLPEIYGTPAIKNSRKGLRKGPVPPKDLPMSPQPLQFIESCISGNQEVGTQENNSEPFLEDHSCLPASCVANVQQSSLPTSLAPAIPQNPITTSTLNMLPEDPSLSMQAVDESSHFLHEPSTSFKTNIVNDTLKNDADESLQQKNTTPAKKSTKPLSSFFDEFLKTVRAATSRQTQIFPSQVPNARRRASRYNFRDNTNPIPSFPSNACFANTSRFDEWSPYSQEEDAGPDLSSDNMHPSSPDILAALKPSQYQVTLSASPSHGTDTLRRSMASLRAFYG